MSYNLSIYILAMIGALFILVKLIECFVELIKKFINDTDNEYGFKYSELSDKVIKYIVAQDENTYNELLNCLVELDELELSEEGKYTVKTLQK